MWIFKSCFDVKRQANINDFNSEMLELVEKQYKTKKNDLYYYSNSTANVVLYVLSLCKSTHEKCNLHSILVIPNICYHILNLTIKLYLWVASLDFVNTRTESNLNLSIKYFTISGLWAEKNSIIGLFLHDVESYLLMH